MKCPLRAKSGHCDLNEKSFQRPKLRQKKYLVWVRCNLPFDRSPMIFHRVESIAHRPQNLLGGRCLVTPFFQPGDEADLPCNTFARCRNMRVGHTQVLKFYFSIHQLNRHKCVIMQRLWWKISRGCHSMCRGPFAARLRRRMVSAEKDTPGAGRALFRANDRSG